jgi:23S rRNA (uracil1939-C5)-methyltransferase
LAKVALRVSHSLLGPLCLEGMAQGGEAVGREGGRVVFVQGGLPGEVVLVRLTETQKAYARGVVERVLQPASERVLPTCPLFGRCGGCHWQYIAYPAQLALKQTIVLEQCRHLGRIDSPPVVPAIGMEEPWAYRSTAELHVGPAGESGYYAAHSHAVVPLGRCPLLVPALNALLPPLQSSLDDISPPERSAQVTLRFSWADGRSLVLLHGGTRRGATTLREHLAGLTGEVAWQRGRQVEVLAGRGFLYETLGGVSLRVSPTSFFQVNVPQAQRLLETVRSLLDPRPGDHLLDAYAGVGALSLPLVPQVGRVTAIESHPAAVADLLENARQMGAEDRVEAIGGLVEQVLAVEERRFDLVLVDPPRRGCLPAALQAIVRSRPRRVVYVSCHPGTLARDLRQLQEGGYRLRQVQPLDLFPQTFHVESVALLEPGEQ